MSLDESTVQDLKAKHGDALVAVESPDGATIVFRKPKRLEYDRWMNRTEKDANVAAVELAKSCRVYPDEAALDLVIEKYPAILRAANGFVTSIIELAGVGEVRSKKL